MDVLRTGAQRARTQIAPMMDRVRAATGLVNTDERVDG